MKTALRWFRVLPMAALALFTCAATARPLLVPPQNLALPPLPGLPPDDYFKPTYQSVAIDGGTLLVGASRPINEQNDWVSGVYIFERNAAGRWAYAGVLTEQWSGDADDQWHSRHHQVSAGDNQGLRTRRDGLGADRAPSRSRSPGVVRIEDGSIYVRPLEALPSHRVRAAVPGISQGEWRLDAGRHHRWATMRFDLGGHQ